MTRKGGSNNLSNFVCGSLRWKIPTSDVYGAGWFCWIKECLEREQINRKNDGSRFWPLISMAVQPTPLRVGIWWLSGFTSCKTLRISRYLVCNSKLKPLRPSGINFFRVSKPFLRFKTENLIFSRPLAIRTQRTRRRGHSCFMFSRRTRRRGHSFRNEQWPCNPVWLEPLKKRLQCFPEISGFSDCSHVPLLGCLAVRWLRSIALSIASSIHIQSRSFGGSRVAGDLQGLQLWDKKKNGTAWNT